MLHGTFHFRLPIENRSRHLTNVTTDNDSNYNQIGFCNRLSGRDLWIA